MADWLQGLKVIDLTSNIAGPTTARMFGELGAEVIKVEPPWGEDARNSTTPFLGTEGTLHLAVNRNKRDIAINLRQPEGRDVMRRLLKDADIFVENTSPGSLERFELGYEAVHALNPRLIYVSITGWGQEGPMASHVGYGLVAAAYAASVMSAPGEGPVPRGGMADPMAALIAAWATMVALRNRERDGQGSRVTTSLLQGALFFSAMGFALPDAEAAASVPGMPGGGALGGIGAFLTSDNRWFYFNIWSNEQFRKLFHLAGMSEIADSPDYDSRTKRGLHAAAINDLLAYWVSTQTFDELLEMVQREELPAAPLHTSVDELVRDPQVLANDVLVRVDHPTKGAIWQLGPTFEIDGDRGSVTPAPLLGQHTEAILLEHGYSSSEIADMRQLGAVV